MTSARITYCETQWVLKFYTSPKQISGYAPDCGPAIQILGSHTPVPIVLRKSCEQAADVCHTVQQEVDGQYVISTAVLLFKRPNGAKVSYRDYYPIYQQHRILTIVPEHIVNTVLPLALFYQHAVCCKMRNDIWNVYSTNFRSTVYIIVNKDSQTAKQPLSDRWLATAVYCTYICWQVW